jgi:hypothetical protein
VRRGAAFQSDYFADSFARKEQVAGKTIAGAIAVVAGTIALALGKE